MNRTCLFVTLTITFTLILTACKTEKSTITITRPQPSPQSTEPIEAQVENQPVTPTETIVIVQPVEPVELQPAAPAPPSPPPAPALTTYTVKRGDTLWRIAERTYGDGHRWRDIINANPGLNPTKLRIGQTIKLPQ